jgi:hypothetical protein
MTKWTLNAIYKGRNCGVGDWKDFRYQISDLKDEEFPYV